MCELTYPIISDGQERLGRETLAHVAHAGVKVADVTGIGKKGERVSIWNKVKSRRENSLELNEVKKKRMARKTCGKDYPSYSRLALAVRK